MMVGAGVVFTEVCVHEGVVRGLVVDPQEEELSGLQIRLELECNSPEGDGF
jgi:hypothetical protein